MLATLRSALEPGAPPPIVAAGAALAASCAAAGVCGGDRGAVQRLVTLLGHPLHHWDALQYCEHSEWVSTQVRLALRVRGRGRAPLVRQRRRQHP